VYMWTKLLIKVPSFGGTPCLKRSLAHIQLNLRGSKTFCLARLSIIGEVDLRPSSRRRFLNPDLATLRVIGDLGNPQCTVCGCFLSLSLLQHRTPQRAQHGLKRFFGGHQHCPYRVAHVAKQLQLQLQQSGTRPHSHR